MENLEQYRKEINAIDDAMEKLFEQRMHIAKEIGGYKKLHGLPIRDRDRESAVITKCRDRVEDKELEPFYVDFQRSVMKVSRDYQTHITEGMKVGFSGVPGAFAYIAAKQLYPDAELIAFPNFEPAFRAAEEGETDCAVLPLENSYAGEVSKVMDLLFSGHLYINQMVTLEVEHQLLSVEGADLSAVRTVVSHPQALSQCDGYIKEHGFETMEYSNTAAAAEYVKKLNDPSFAAIASRETAELCGLQILDRNIHSMKNNTSRFGVFSRRLHLPSPEAKDDSCGFILMFTVPNEAGALAMILDLIGSHGFNMRSLMSRPMKDLLWSYYFYAEVEGNISTDEGQAMLQEIRAICGQLKLAGTYFTTIYR